MQTEVIPKIDQAKKLWDDRGMQETDMHSIMPVFQEFWDEEFRNLTTAMQQTVIEHYLNTGEIPL